MQIPVWLIALITVLIVVLIILALYMIVAFRRMAITAKKMDYLTEDFSYKLEKLSPSLDSLIKLSNYIDILDNLIKADGPKIVNKFSQNKDDILKLINQVKDFLKSPNSVSPLKEENSVENKLRKTNSKISSTERKENF